MLICEDRNVENMKLSEVLSRGESALRNAEIAEAKLDAWYLFETAFGMSRVEYLMNQQNSAMEECCARYEAMIQKRSQHIPLQHITGTQEFMGFDFDVNEHVLIPRQDTECLVERVMKYAQNKSVLDVCTGSGCIIISLEKLCRLSSATALDISDKALETARKNAKKLQAQVNFIESDLFSQIHEKYDIIVSNPPYIPTKVIEGLMEEVKEHEPMLALDGKEDGLYFYRKIIMEAGEHLNTAGMLFFEIGHDQADAVSKLMQEHGFTGIMVEKDLAGLDRIVYGKID